MGNCVGSICGGGSNVARNHDIDESVQTPGARTAGSSRQNPVIHLETLQTQRQHAEAAREQNPESYLDPRPAPAPPRAQQSRTQQSSTQQPSTQQSSTQQSSTQQPRTQQSSTQQSSMQPRTHRQSTQRPSTHERGSQSSAARSSQSGHSYPLQFGGERLPAASLPVSPISEIDRPGSFPTSARESDEESL
jgi:outer membrane biosynthesis protein TonB